jgi:hypothetical protein
VQLDNGHPPCQQTSKVLLRWNKRFRAHNCCGAKGQPSAPLNRSYLNRHRLASGWPATQQILARVELAVPLFIYAATVCRYVGTKGGDPEEYLNKVLQYPKAAFLQLDRTYLPVLDQLLGEQEERDKEDWLHNFRRLVGSIVILESPLSVGPLARLP